MLEKIKSIYFSRNLLSSLEESRKLKLIKYNKNFQNMINLTLINFKRLSGKYIIFDNNGKGKEYDIYSKNLIFEGEYLEGKKWNGKGYDKNNVSIEIKNGKGFMKFYYSNGQIKNDCEFLDGEIKGKVKQYDSDGQLLFEGEYLNGLRNGRGEEYNFNGKIIFEGEYLSGWKYTGIETEYNNKGEILDLNYIINGRYKKFPIGNSEIILLAIKYPKSFGILNN